MFLLKNGFFCFLLWMYVFTASALGVSPTLLEISSSNPIASIILTNERDIPITVQLETVRWEQYQEKEVYVPTEDLIVTPKIFIIQPNSSQLVRMGFEKNIFKKKELAYRLFAQEVFPKLRSKSNELKIALRLSVPVIVKPITPIQQEAKWHIEELRNNNIKISAHNTGNSVIFINLLQALSDKHLPITKDTPTFAYLLPGTKKTWNVKTVAKKRPSLIKASINHRVVVENVT